MSGTEEKFKRACLLLEQRWQQLADDGWHDEWQDEVTDFFKENGIKSQLSPKVS